MQIILILLRTRLVPVLRVLKHLLPYGICLRAKVVFCVIVVVPILRPAELIRPVRVRVAVLVKIALHLLRGLRRAGGSVPAPIPAARISGLIPDFFCRRMRSLHPCGVASGFGFVVLVCIVLNSGLLFRTQSVSVGGAYRHVLTPSYSGSECSLYY